MPSASSSNQPPSPETARRVARPEDGRRDQAEVPQRPHGQEPGPPAVRRHGERHRRHHQGKQDQQVDHRLFLQLRQVLRADRGELAADVVDDDAHHEHAGEQVEQHADLDEERHRLQQQQAEQEDPVLQDR